MSVITNRKTVEVTIERVYGEDTVYIEHEDGRRNTCHASVTVEEPSILTTMLRAPEHDHVLGLASLGRLQALDHLRR